MLSERNINKVIGGNIRSARYRLNMPMAVLAKKVKLSQPQLSRLETGLQGCRPVNLVRIAKALNVNCSSLLQNIL